MLTRSLVMQLLRCDRDGRGGVHLVTVDGLDYDLQADGDFTLVRSTQPGEQFDIQIRTEPWAEHPLTSLTVKAAGQVSRHAVKFGLGGFSRVDAVLDSSLSADGSLQDLCGGTL